MATILLKLALTLLIAAQGPNVPENLKIQAISVATQAIQYAESQQISAPISQTVQTEAQPIFGSVQQAPVSPSCTLNVTSTTTPTDTVYAFDWTTQDASEGQIIEDDSSSRFVNLGGTSGNSISSGHWGRLQDHVGWTSRKGAMFLIRLDGGTGGCEGIQS